MINWQKLFKSFKYAFRGIVTVYKTEQNFRIHILLGLMAVLLGVIFQIKLWQWCLIVFLILFILMLELVNTAFERFVDMLKPRVHLYAKQIKDIMSAMVLLTAFGAIIVGLIIFLPYIFELF